MDEDLWAKLDAASKRAKADRSDVLRRFARWYVGEPNAELPQRPEVDE
ncbi:hypothetical protein ABZU92_18245 [Micromonospora arida]